MLHGSRFASAAWLALAFILPAARADVRLPYILAEHMVVQRGLPVHIWGSASPGEKVTVSFRGERRTASADNLGRWSVYLSPGEPGGPFSLEIKGRNTITFQDVLVGEVWIAAGQSNMEWPVRWAANPAAEIAASAHPRIRLVRTMHRVSDYPLENFIGRQWEPCGPETVPHFSAVGYHFGRLIHENTGVPVGLIQVAWGGTPAEAWTSLPALTADASLMPVFAEWARMTHDHATALARYALDKAEWRAAGQTAAEPAPPKGPGGPWEPAVLFNGMTAPLTRFPIRGVIWYQGESNTAAERAPVYGRLFETLIRDWRRAWGQGDFPFLFVQLANFRTPPEAMWPELRDAQRRALGLASTAMAVTIDIGEPDNIHPGNKREVGRRLALAARAVAYGEKIEYSGPLFRHALAEEKGAVRVWFNHTGTALQIRGAAPHGFELAGSDLRWRPADARIEGLTVVLQNPKVPAPAFVRYAWADNPRATLFNSEGLPASPFESATAR